MSKESQQLLRDANIKPTKSIIAACLGTTSKVYHTFLEELKEYDITFMDWRYYNDSKAWLSKGEYKWITSRGTHKVKPIFWVSIWEGFFKISFSFYEQTKEPILALPISEDTKEIIKNIEPNGNKMKFLSIIFNVDREKQLNDIFLLSQFRKENI